MRRADVRDADTVAMLIAEMAAAFGQGPEMDASHVATYLAHPGAVILLAELEEAPVGLLSYRLAPDLFHGALNGHICELIVRAHVRGRGVATALLTQALTDMRAAQCVEVSISVDPDDTEAARLYRQLGLVEESLQLERHFRRAASDA